MRISVLLKGLLAVAPLWALIFFILLMVHGCAGIIPLSQVEKLTPEQITAYKDSGYKIWTCFRLVGPAPVGQTMFILTPKDSTVQYTFTSDCIPQPR